jgi:hypothetical protein
MPSPTHWTYAPASRRDDDLNQGDILLPEEPLVDVFREVHKHFADPKYCAFLVLTQTCDLVRHDGAHCKSRYVNLAVVRPLGDVLFSLLDRCCERVNEGWYRADGKQKARLLLERILNQNEQAMGLFYLHPDAAIGIVEPSVALLQVSVAVRSQEHYQTLVRCREGRLVPEFQSKLGWLTGNLFSRVATRDWHERRQDQEELERLINELLFPDAEAPSRPAWVSSKELARAARSGAAPFGQLDEEQRKQLLRSLKRIPPKDVAIDRALHVVREVVPDVSDKQLDRIRIRLRNDPDFSASCR